MCILDSVCLRLETVVKKRDRQKERKRERSVRLMACLKESPMTELSMYSLFECIFRPAIMALMHISVYLLYIRSRACSIDRNEYEHNMTVRNMGLNPLSDRVSQRNSRYVHSDFQ